MTYISAVSNQRPPAPAFVQLPAEIANQGMLNVGIGHSPNPSNSLLTAQATYCYIGDIPLDVEKETISQVFARNLAAAMAAAHSGRGINQSELAAALKNKVPQTTISLYLRPGARLSDTVKVAPSPTLERVALIAAALGTDPWMLLHPDPAQARGAVALIEEVRRNLGPAVVISPSKLHGLVMDASKKNPPPAPVPENVRSLKKARRLRLGRGSITAPITSQGKKKK